MFKPPQQLLVTSDDTLLEFKKVNTKNKNQKEDTYVYEYITSLSKRGVEVLFTESYLTQQMNNYFKEI